MNIKTETVGSNAENRITLEDRFDNRRVKISDMPWVGEVYIEVSDPDLGILNAIIERKHLEKFMKASKPAKKKKPTAQEKLKALKIGTRFTTETGNEWIKVGDDNFIETDEKLAIRGVKFGGFLQAEHFKGKITVVED